MAWCRSDLGGVWLVHLRRLLRVPVEVALGHHRHEDVDLVLAPGVRPLAEPIGLEPPVDGLAGEPVLLVRDVPELAGVVGREAWALLGLGREQPLALDLAPT